ncbi:MAG: carbamoyl phosphate synthase large subunit [Bdellovibrionales bacterium RIFCSPHIGHO2_01_FULL_40_29]|nr:MAG: carbamoyl phosphate synthase large subunit [Bdellovibrionales bacterium RIFCSPHIGHO2_01_FULL_40_29]OFZ35453.1 MAG: carbamoyl phosphate synthase large subunit [Bdellovibrionales bacterium RIFCSPHIGHO2_02_FULL_40_15]
MPKNQSIKRILIIGSGPIQIGQACEFDYSGTQACKALMKEGFEVILVNSNPATIMTDPEIATRTYIEPLKVQYLEKIIEIEKPQAVIPTLGGQTALNLALELDRLGILKKHNVQMLGATPAVIEAAEDREKFRSILDELGAKYPQSEMVKNFEHGLLAADRLGYPIILRPNYTLGGGGGGVAYSPEEYKRMLVQALHESPTSEVLVEESILGWKEFELEVMRDASGTFVVVCSIENFDPCGVHTGDSITVAPQQTLTDDQYQDMRDEACRIISRVGVQTGGANIQFAVHPTTHERVVIEMNPRVSRSSALASKATGFPIAKIAALLAVGYLLDELKNDITKVTPTCYEPALDYVVTKIPRFAFEKFQGSKDILSTQMKSVGEVMSMGRTFQESLMKALAALEMNSEGIPDIHFNLEKMSYPNSQRIWHIFQAMRHAIPMTQIQELTKIDPWFLEQIAELVKFENKLKTSPLELPLLTRAKKFGFTDARIGKLKNLTAKSVRDLRHTHHLRPSYLQVDTCAGEFLSSTPYFYSTYWSRAEKTQPPQNIVAVIGSGPNRIGQGIEFDYSCVRGVQALQKLNYAVAMLNSNPETVSTDYDTSDYLFFEPLTEECVLEVFDFIQPKGFIAQLGGQTPISLAHGLVQNGYKLLGSSLESLDQAEDRKQFAEICRGLNLMIPQSTMVGGLEEALACEKSIGYPMICRPSYVLGGRRMEVIENQGELISYFQRHQDFISSSNPCLMDQFLTGALEVDVDLVRGLEWTVMGGIVEHIEVAGVHSGDSMGVVPPQRLKPETLLKIEEMSRRLADRLDVKGHLNLQLAVKDDVIFILEANPRSSRSVPFLAKATGIPLIDLGIAAQLGLKLSIEEQNKYQWRNLSKICVKGVVFPFKKFTDSDSILGPEMKSTGESMGRASTYSEALVKAFLSSSITLPAQGEVFLSLRDKDKVPLLPILKNLKMMGYQFSATRGTADYLKTEGIDCLMLNKVHEGRPHCVDRIRSGEVQFVVNTTEGRHAIEASFDIRRACTDYSIPCLTESDAAQAFVLALEKSKTGRIEVSHLA